jgi:peptidoglycan hydrolase-like protein with peptidoglycan-binding domain
MAIDNSPDPFFDENAEEHQWNPDSSGENQDHVPGFDAYGNPIDFPQSDCPEHKHENEYEHEHPGDEENTWETQDPSVYDGAAEEHDSSDAYTDDQTPEPDFDIEETPDKSADYDSYPQPPEPMLGGANEASVGTNYEEFDAYLIPPANLADGSQDAQLVDNDSNHSAEEATETWQERSLQDFLDNESTEDSPIALDAVGVFGDKPTSPQPTEQEHAAQKSIHDASTLQQGDQPSHKDAHATTTQALRTAPTLDEILGGSAVLGTGHEGEAVEAIHQLLGLEADKTFSSELAAAVSEFQESEGIKPTGEVDQVTLQALQDVEYDRLHPKQVTLNNGTLAVGETKKQSRQPSQSAEPQVASPQEPPELESPKLIAQESLLGNVSVTPNLEAGLQTVLNVLPPEVQKAVQGELKQLWDSTEKVPWLRDALGKAVQTAEEPLARARQIAGLWESLPDPLRDTVVSMIPFGDGVDLIDQTLKKMQGKPVDPVIVIMASIGLGADAGWLDGIIPDPADAANFATGFLKGAYKAMDEPAKEILTKIVEKAAKNKEVLGELVGKVGQLSKYAEVLAKHPNAMPRLLKLEKEEVSKIVADPKKLERAIEQSEVINKYAGKKWEQLGAAEQAEIKKHYKVYEKTNRTTVISQREDIGLQMHVDKDGLIKEGSLRTISPLRISTDQMRKRLKDADIKILEGHPIHHKIPITAAENDPLAKAARELGYDVNNVDNLKQLPGSSAARENLTEPLLMPEHGKKNFHPEWITHAENVLADTLDQLVEAAGAPGLKDNEAVQYLLEHGYEDEILKAMKKVEQTLDKDLLKDSAPWIKHNTAGEKVIATNTPGSKESQMEVG